MDFRDVQEEHRQQLRLRGWVTSGMIQDGGEWETLWIPPGASLGQAVPEQILLGVVDEQAGMDDVPTPEDMRGCAAYAARGSPSDS